jgi:AcrR family transcriptional regulator
MSESKGGRSGSSGEDARKPGRDSRKPGAGAHKPVQDGRMPGADTHKPAQDGRMPGADTHKPAQDGRMPGADTHKPVQDGRMPGAGTHKPVQDGRNKPGADTHTVTASARKATGSASKASGGASKPAKTSDKPKQPATPKIVPIYARLPRGPHPLGAPGVAHNQRIRIHGGMIEAVTTRGYSQTSVKLVVGLAGVSRRAFYEQFSGKEECFTATNDLIVNRAVKRLTDAYRTAEGNEQQRLRAVLQAWGAELEQNPKALRLAIAESQTAGAEGLRRLQQTTAVCEGLLAGALSGRCPPAGGGEPDDNPETLPLPVVRAIVGGLRRATQMRLLDDDTEDLEPLVHEMVKWTLLFKSPELGRLRPRRCANQPHPETLELELGACGGAGLRARVLRSAIEAGLCEQKFADLSAPRIADVAGLPFEAVMELYPDPHACYLEALDALGDELLQLIASPELMSPQWPAAVCRTIDALLAYLAGSPARLMTLTVKALEAGPAAIANVGDLAYELATLLTEGAPRRPRTRIAIEGIAGGLWNILYCEALAGRGHRLPLLSEFISYVVLTPYLGPEEAVEAIVGSRAAPATGNGAAGNGGTTTENGAARLPASRRPRTTGAWRSAARRSA